MSNSQAPNSLKRVRTISKVLHWFCLFAILFQIAVIPMVWYVPGWVEASSSQMTVSIAELHALSGWQKYMTMAVMMIPALVMTYGLYRLRLMFGAFADNAIFQPDTISHLRVFGIALLAQTLIKPMTGAATSVLATFHRPAGERMLSIGLGNAEASTLFLGGLIIVIAWVLGEAARIDAENRSFV
jgi:cytochrome b561